MSDNPYSVIKPEIIVKERKPRKWKDDPIEDCFYFWNHSFTIKQHPSRPIKTRCWQFIKKEHKCSHCGNLSEHTKIMGFWNGAHGHPKRYCVKCYNMILGIERESWENKKETDDKIRINSFMDKLSECKKLGTCDILAAHHEVLKGDPERLTTEFLIGMVCGDKGLEKYDAR